MATTRASSTDAAPTPMIAIWRALCSSDLCSASSSPKCLMNQSVWWALMMDGFTEDMLTGQQRAVIARIQAEPESLMLTPEEAATYE